MKATNLGSLKRNDIFSFNGQNVKWRVSQVVSELAGRVEVPRKIICYSLNSNKKRSFYFDNFYNYDGISTEMFNRAVIVHSAFDITGNSRPVKIEDGEWYFKGCFITEQNHPKLNKYHIHQDTDENLTVGTCNTWEIAQRMCEGNAVENPKNGAEAFIKIYFKKS